MAQIELTDAHTVSEYSTPYFVAELNTSHNGNLDTAKLMIEQAKWAGCDCVKFQSWSPGSLYSESFYIENPIARRMVGKFALEERELEEAAKHCAANDISFASTPDSKREVDFLLECNAPFIKVSSMDIVNYPFLQYIAKTQAPVVLSTGMADSGEVRKAVEVFERAGNTKLCILHCNSLYPTSEEDVSLLNIIGLREDFPNFPIGFSDHTVGPVTALAAVGMGAALIEKHFTLDNSKIGMDNQMATEPSQMRALINQCKTVASSLGKKERILSQDELVQRSKMRRSIVSTRSMPAGTVLSLSDLDAKRPGTGLPPELMSKLVGATLIEEVPADTLIVKTNLDAETVEKIKNLPEQNEDHTSA